MAKKSSTSDRPEVLHYQEQLELVRESEKNRMDIEQKRLDEILRLIVIMEELNHA